MNGESGACEGAWFSFCPYPKVSGNPKVSRGALTGFGRRLLAVVVVVGRAYLHFYLGMGDDFAEQLLIHLVAPVVGAALRHAYAQFGLGRPEHDAKITLNIIVTGKSSLCGFMAGM